ncbi:cytoskeleton-associated protein 2 [Elgaria multicarinata webbii]|uniref:cytoskeleton-associated protein 2 n=1 Tax=Elgaria multicarinata webbii TaxID=159646 RepID=UPI002FCD07F2
MGRAAAAVAVSSGETVTPVSEDKENVNGSTWNQMDSTPEKNLASPKALKSPTILKQITTAINCSPLASTTAVVSEPADMKNKGISYSQTFLSKRNMKEKQVKTVAPNPSACLSEKRVLGSYRGRIVSSKINSFRKISENEGTRYSLAAPPKLAMRTGFTRNSTGTKNARVTGTVSKAAGITSLQARPPVKVSVSHPKTILNQEKPSVNSTVNKGAAQRNPNKNWKPVLKTGPPNASNSVHRSKKPVPPKTETGILARPVSETHSTVSASKSVDNRKSIPAKPADLRRTQLAEWRASKGIKKVPAPISAETETPQQTVKEPVESFWAAIAEEDEQRLVSDRVNKTLTECLSLIEKGHPGDTVHSTLEKLIMTVPGAKRFAKYWVCQMRLEQFRTTEKVLTIYENAILARAQPKDELRHALADAMKMIKNLSKSDDECVKEENPLNHEAEVNSDEGKIENAFKEVHFSKNLESNNEETSQKATEACLKSEEESFPHEKKHRDKELSQKPTVIQKAEQNSGNAEKDQILELNSPESGNAGSYLIKYNLSTTPSLERTKKKLQAGANDSAVKDLKFLTPVRRSRRINEKVCKLPNMLKDHNSCVSSLEQLGELGDGGTGIVYRQNSALHKVTLHQQGQGKERHDNTECSSVQTSWLNSNHS